MEIWNHNGLPVKEMEEMATLESEQYGILLHPSSNLTLQVHNLEFSNPKLATID